MSGKQKPSKKAVKEKQNKVIEDSTFGLKNKNKSKKVQQFIDRVEKQVKHSNGAGDAVRKFIISLVYMTPFLSHFWSVLSLSLAFVIVVTIYCW